MITLRERRADDLELVLELISEREYAPLTVRGLSGERRREGAKTVYKAYWDAAEDELALYLAEREGECVGLMCVSPGSEESITGDKQTLIHDHYVRPVDDRLSILRALEEKAVTLAEKAGDDYLVVELPPGDPDEELFTDLGYRIEINRIAKVLEEHPIRENSRYLIREGRPTDHMFVCYLNSLVNNNTIPAGRDHDPIEVGARYLENYFQMSMTDGETQVYICERKDVDALEEIGFRQAGYLLIKTGFIEPIARHSLAYIYDLAIHPDHWGRRATQLLMRDVERRLAEQGHDIFTGDISERNPRALKTSIKSLGFTLEYRRWGRKL